MKIEYKDYTMETSSEGGFNLSKRVLRNKVDENKKPTGETYDFDSVIGYNMQFRSCINKIIHLELCEKDEVMSLKEAVDLWNSKYEEIKQIIKF